MRTANPDRIFKQVLVLIMKGEGAPMANPKVLREVQGRRGKFPKES